MATVAPSSDQAVDLMQKLSLDSQTKNTDISEPMKKPSSDSGTGSNGYVQLVDRSVTPVQDFYHPGGYASAAYYYGGYDGNSTEWDDYTRYVSPDGLEMTSGVYADNGSVVYHPGYGYAPYSAYSPAAAGSSVPTLGHDVHQLYGAQQHYQYPTTPYFQQPTPTTDNQGVTLPKGDISTTAGAPAAGQVSLSVDTSVSGNSTVFSSSTAGGGTIKGNTTSNSISGPVRSAYQNSSLNGNSDSYGRGSSLPAAASGYQDPVFNYNYNNGYNGIRSPVPWIDGPLYSDIYHPRNLTSSMNSSISNNNNGNSLPTSRHHHLHPNSHPMGMHHPSPTAGNVYMNRTYSNKLYGGGHHGNTFRSSLGFGSNYNSNNAYTSRTDGVGQGWLAVDNKFRLRGRSRTGFCGYYCSENVDGLNELNRGPRTKSNSLDNQKDVGFTPSTLVMQVADKNIALAGANDNKDDDIIIPDRDQYNRADFPVYYEDAKFFIIKSYSEDDVHKSIKYNVWSSTQNGNKKLDAVYQEAQQKPVACPIFLFFSVNTSGQFVGVAEMVGPVDFNKSVDYWQQDKWIGCFPVKWHIVKDVPNTSLKHITLENNENKPVTNSRDTQEVKLEQGLQLLKIFKDHSSKQCILDDFDFYADRQRRIQEKKAKQLQFHRQVQERSATLGKSKAADIDLKIQNTALESASPIVNSSNPPSVVIVSSADVPAAVAGEKVVVV